MYILLNAECIVATGSLRITVIITALGIIRIIQRKEGDLLIVSLDRDCYYLEGLPE